MLIMCFYTVLLYELHHGETCYVESQTAYMYRKNHLFMWELNIQIYHGCEGRIEKSVSRTTVWHHEACCVMTNGDPEGRVFSILPSHE